MEVRLLSAGVGFINALEFVSEDGPTREDAKVFESFAEMVISVVVAGQHGRLLPAEDCVQVRVGKYAVLLRREDVGALVGALNRFA